MTVPRLFTPHPLSPGAVQELPQDAAHHAARVLRLRVGDPVTLFNGLGGEYAARIASVTRRSVQIQIETFRAVEREPPLSLVLVQAISSGDRMDVTIQKAVELGVARICPVTSRRGVVRLPPDRAEKRMAHWRQIVVSACEQCGRNRIPPLDPVEDLPAFLSRETGSWPRWVLSPDAHAIELRRQERPAGGLTLLVGPEGGLTDDEHTASRERGFVPVRLGPRILRTETAAAALLAAVQVLWGDF